MNRIYLIRLPVKLREFTEWAWQQGCLALPKGDGSGKPRDADTGYALHMLLTSLFGQQAPRPFRPPPLGQREQRAGANQLEIWGYTSQPAEALCELAKLADDKLYAMVDWSEVRSKPMPAKWPEGVHLRFELRACPVMRLMQQLDDRRGNAIKKGKEVDAYQVGVIRNKETSRDKIYIQWLADRFAPKASAQQAAVLIQDQERKRYNVRVDSYRSSRLLRRPLEKTGKERESAWLTRPDVCFSGILEIVDSTAFSDLLVRGVGRHCGFGFGMLLLKPA